MRNWFFAQAFSSSRRRRHTKGVLRFTPSVIALEHRLLPSTFTVTGTGDSGPGSLRQAILDSNGTPGVNAIVFDIMPSGVQTIRPAAALPTIVVPVTIDGTTEPGSGGVPMIELAGPGASSSVDGLTISAGNSIVRGLIIRDFGNGIHIKSNGGNLIAGDFVGTDASGELAMGNRVGVLLEPCDDNTIGGTAAAGRDRNVISGNSSDGIWAIENPGLLVQGNYIGTDAMGTRALGNHQDGLFFDSASTSMSATIGGTEPGAGNVIADNGIGLHLGGGHHLVQGNRIGTNATGTAPLGNTTGIRLKAGAGLNTIGGIEAGAGNLISGNGTGIVTFSGSIFNVIQGNRIGTDATGTLALGNDVGIDLGSAYNQIGGIAPGARNLISGNGEDGIVASGGHNVFQGNFIGTDITGTLALGNGHEGIYLFYEGSYNSIGGTEAGAGNVISANGGDGVFIELVNHTPVQGNHIGTGVNGTETLGNGGHGVHLGGTIDDMVGGIADAAGNTIAYNGGDGILVDGGSQNGMFRNSIFTNGNLGIELTPGANNDQAFPDVTSAVVGSTGTVIQGTLTSTPDTSFRLEFFSNSMCNPSGYGEGEQFLGWLIVTTNDSGLASFTTTCPAVDKGKFITSTATDPNNNTSSFSACVAVTGPHLGLPPPVGSLAFVEGNEWHGWNFSLFRVRN
jgi:hypothetical protein